MKRYLLTMVLSFVLSMTVMVGIGNMFGLPLYHKEYKTYPIIYLGSLNAIKVLPVIYNCPFWVRDIVNMFGPFSFSIKQTSIRRIGHNDIDCNYARNIDKLKINHPKR